MSDWSWREQLKLAGYTALAQLTATDINQTKYGPEISGPYLPLKFSLWR